MKRRRLTIDTVELRPDWQKGYVGEIGGTRIRFYQRSRVWVASRWFGWITVATGKTLREAVKAAREAL